MFPCVWLHFKKFSEKYFLVFGKEEGKHKSRKHKSQLRKKKIINDENVSSPTTAPSITLRDRDQRRDRDRADDRDIGLELELAISDWSWSSRRLRSRRIGAREIDANWSSEFAGDRRTDWIFSSRARTLSLSLSLSLSFSENALKGK